MRNGLRYARHRTRKLVTHDDARRAELDSRFTIRSSDDVARELGQMKGALMKFGQLLSFILEALPEEAQRSLSSLQSDAPPMAPELAAQVVLEELGKPPERAFLDWDSVPVAAASVGQVHRAVSRDGRDVAVKVQYPGVGEAIESDLDNAQALYRLFTAFALKGLDAKALVDELRGRMREELDYRLEAANQTAFATHYTEHPFVHIPAVIPATSTTRVLTTEWVDGVGFAEFMDTAAVAARRRAGESIWRFAQASVHHLGAFNGVRIPATTASRWPATSRSSTSGWSSGGPTASGSCSNRASTRSSCIATRSGSSGRWRRSASCARATGCPRRTSTTTSVRRTGRTSATSSRSPARSCAKRCNGSSTSRARTRT